MYIICAFAGADDEEGVDHADAHKTQNQLLEENFPDGSRLTQITDWLGADGGECLIVLDECHKAKNLVDDGASSEHIFTPSCNLIGVLSAAVEQFTP